MKESQFQKSALKFLNSLNGCVAENVSGNSQQSGRPDINGVYCGMSFRIELKVIERENRPTFKQFFNLLKWFKSGSAICVAYDLNDIKHFIVNSTTKIPWETKQGTTCMSFGYYREDDCSDEFFRAYRKLYIQD